MPATRARARCRIAPKHSGITAKALDCDRFVHRNKAAAHGARSGHDHFDQQTIRGRHCARCDDKDPQRSCG